MDFITYDEYFTLHPQEVQQKISAAKAKSQNLLMVRKGNAVPKPPVITDIQPLRDQLLLDAQEILSRPAESRVVVLTSSMGTGKTTTVAHILGQRLDQPLGNKSNQGIPLGLGRVVFLMQRKADVEKIYLTIAKYAPDKTFLMLGRSPDPESPFYCPDYYGAEKAGQNRWNPACNCEEGTKGPCRYVKKQREMMALLKEQSDFVVVAPYASFINDGDKLRHFDRVINDESIFDTSLVEMVQVTRHDIRALYEQQNKSRVATKYPQEHPLWVFIEGLQRILDLSDSLMGNEQVIEFRDKWVEVYPGSEADLEALLHGEVDIDKFKYPSFDIEKNYKIKRFIVDLIRAIQDPRLGILITQNGILFARTQRAIDYLRNMELIILDATPNKSLLEDVFDRVEYVGDCYNLSNLDIIQICGRVYTRSLLQAQPSKRREVEQLIDFLIDEFALEAPFPVVQKPLYCPDFEDPKYDKKLFLTFRHPNVKMAYFGGETKGSNRFQDRDSIFLVGHYQQPFHITELFVNAIRRSEPVKGKMSLVLKQMSLVGNTEIVPGRLQHCHPDPLVQTVNEHFMSSNVIQAMGRLRALLRPGKKLRAFILNGTILEGIPIDKVLQVDDLLREIGLKKLGRQKPKELVQRHSKTQKEIIDTLCQEVCQNPMIGRNALSQKTGYSPITVSKYLKRIQDEIQLGNHEVSIYVLYGTREPRVVQERVLMSLMQMNLYLQFKIDFDRFMGWQNVKNDQTA